MNDRLGSKEETISGGVILVFILSHEEVVCRSAEMLNIGKKYKNEDTASFKTAGDFSLKGLTKWADRFALRACQIGRWPHMIDRETASFHRNT